MHRYGAVFALGDMALSVGYILGPLVGTTLYSHLGFDHAMSVYAGVVLVTTPVVWFLKGREPESAALLHGSERKPDDDGSHEVLFDEDYVK